MPSVKQITHKEDIDDVTIDVLDGYKLAPVDMYIDDLPICGVQYSIIENGE